MTISIYIICVIITYIFLAWVRRFTDGNTLSIWFISVLISLLFPIGILTGIILTLIEMDYRGWKGPKYF